MAAGATDAPMYDPKSGDNVSGLPYLQTVKLTELTNWIILVYYKSVGLINKVDMVCLSPVGYGV